MTTSIARIALLCLAGVCSGAEEYPLGPDSQPQPNVPKGTITQQKFHEMLVEMENTVSKHLE